MKRHSNGIYRFHYKFLAFILFIYLLFILQILLYSAELTITKNKMLFVHVYYFSFIAVITLMHLN